LAGGIAIINSIGNLSGFAGPFVMGWVKDRTGSFTDGLLVLAGAALVAMVIVLALGHDTALEKTPSHRASPAE
jgi:ACS family tartrate transporter-like MFS transporter